MVELLKEKHRGLPIFLLGESMGGIIVLNYATDYKEKLAGIILLAAGIKGNLKIVLRNLFLPETFYGLINQKARVVNFEKNMKYANRIPGNIELMKKD